MNKAQLIENIAKQAKLSKKESEALLSSLMDSVSKTLAKGEKVTLVGFGTFVVSNRKARTGRNPRSGKPIHIPATKVPKFRAGQELKKAVNK